jgi:hypothetical protein
VEIGAFGDGDHLLSGGRGTRADIKEHHGDVTTFSMYVADWAPALPYGDISYYWVALIIV